MLTRLDDFPRHQIIDTMAHVGTSDLSFSDGFYFCFWDPEGQMSLAAGMRVYPNVDVVDGYIAIMAEGRLQNVRMSRRWSPRQDDLDVGPLSLEIVEGLRTRRLRLADPGLHGGIRFDLLWQATHAPYAEDRRSERLHGRVVRDLIRYWQAGRPKGHIELGARSFEVDERWYCIMDHSWGTRQSVGPKLNPADLPPVPMLPPGRDGLLRLVVFAQMPSYIVYLQTHEDASGRVLMAEGRIDHADGQTDAIVKVEHDLAYQPGSRKIRSGRCTATTTSGRTLALSLRPSHTPTITSALGYQFETSGFGDNRGMGVYRGDHWIESDIWRHDGNDAVAPDGTRHAYNGYIGPAAASDGENHGMAYFETVVIGSYPRYGFAAAGPIPVTVLPIS